MKTFLFVLSFILILFGVSIWYYRSNPEGGFKLPKISLNPFAQPEATPTPEKEGSVAGEQTESFQSLEIVEGTSGQFSAGQRRVYFAVAKTPTGGSVSVNGTWYLSDDKIGSLESSQGVETTLKTVKEGRAKLFLSYANLKAEKELTVVGSVLGTGTLVTPTVTPKKEARPSASPTPTPLPEVGELPADEAGETAQPTATPAPRVVAINIYDLDGRRLGVGDSRRYQARVVFSDGAEKDLEVDWSLSGDLGTLSRVHASSTDFKALKTGQGLLKVGYRGVENLLAVQVN